MSAYTKIACEFNDKDMLIGALHELGYTPQVWDSPQQLQDYHGKFRQDRAHIIIPRAQLNHASNDVGFVRTSDGKYTAIISDYDKGCTFTQHKLETLKLAYNRRRALQIAERQGMRLIGQSESTVEGKRHIQYQFLPK